MENNTKKVIVTGCTGQDGSYMCEYLLANTDLQVIGAIRRTSQDIVSNLSKCLPNPRFSLISLDLSDVHSITNLIKSETPNYFLNFAGATFVADSWNQPALTMAVNAVSLIHILEAVRAFVPHCRVYSSGSSEQWGDVAYSPQDEKHPMRPRSVYGVSKCAAGLTCKVYRDSYGLYAVHGLLTNHESPRRQSYFVTRKVTLGAARIRKAMTTGDPFEPIELGNVNAERDWSHAKDFVDGIWRMMNQEKYRKTQKMLGGSHENLWLAQEGKSWLNEYVLSSNETHTIREMVEIAFGRLAIEGKWEGEGDKEKFVFTEGSSRHVLVQVNPKFYRPAEVAHLLGDSTLARTELDWKPQYSFKKLIEEMVVADYYATKSS